MNSPKQRRLRHIETGAVLLGALLLAMLFTTSASADASAGVTTSASSNPCPSWAIQDVFDDPQGDWDRDRVPNGTELEYGESPCVPVKASFCTKQPSLCTVRYVAVSARCNYGTYWNLASVKADPNTDWDGDGIKNLVEVNNGANPCAHPCPRPSQHDVALNPWADWDNDGVSNFTEVRYRTDPCQAPVVLTPTATPTPRPVVQRPVVDVTPSAPPPGYACPANFPYYYASTGYCHASRLRTR